MFYTVATADWTPDRPLTLSLAPAGLQRTRDAARKIAVGRSILAVAVWYDATRCLVVAQGPVARRHGVEWEAPAIRDSRGGLRVLAAIPADLVRVIGPADIRVHAASLGPFPWSQSPRHRHLGSERMTHSIPRPHCATSSAKIARGGDDGPAR